VNAQLVILGGFAAKNVARRRRGKTLRCAQRDIGAIALAAVLLAACGGQAAPSVQSSTAPASVPASGSVAPASKPAPASPSASAAPASKQAAASPIASKPAALTPLHIAIAQASANQIIWPLTKASGYFEKYGLDVKLDSIEGSAGATAALISGDLDAATIPGQAIAAAQAGGADLVMIGGLVNASFLKIMAVPSVKSIEDVKGKTVAITKTGASDYWTWKEVMDHYGWKDSDITFVNANTIQGQVALLQRGEAQAIAVGSPSNLIAEKSGAHLVLDVTTLNLASQQNGVTAFRKTLQAKRPAMLDLMKATAAGIARWRSDPQFSKDFIKSYLRDDDPADIEAIYQGYLPVFAKAPYPSRDGFAKVIQEVSVENPKVKDLSPDQLMDASLVKELEDSGFIAQLYPS